MVQSAQTQNGTAASQKVKKKDFIFTVNISPDKMHAHLILEKDSKADKNLAFNFEENELIAVLNEAGVKHGINSDKISSLAAGNPIFDKPFEIARGTLPEKGNDAEFELLFDTSNDKTPTVDDDGFIDYKDLNIIKNAVKGQPLAKKIPTKPGKPGTDVAGNTIEGQPGKDRALPKGKNTEISPDDPDLLIASKDGSISFANNLVLIDDVFSVHSDVDMSTGNIDFVGNLKISGGVKAGFTIKAGGSIEIGKNIEDAEINCGGSVIAKGGFVGSGKGTIKAKEDVFVKYVENQSIEAGNEVHVGGGAMNATIHAGNSVIIEGNKAIIVGGSITAVNTIKAGTIGSEFGTPTLVRVGYSSKLVKELDEIDEEIERLNNDTEKISKTMYSLVRLEIENKLSKQQKDALKQLKDHRDGIPNQTIKLEERKEEINRQLNENKNAKIIVTGNVYPGTTVQIGLLKKEFNKTLKNCTLKISQGQVTFVSN
ncbi:MAG: DUF342 domain-containing protein [candidate division Zixibacteria bacterium]|nr:DUF342 domain-containing protein [candidate division Zixibacteria bacterium]